MANSKKQQKRRMSKTKRNMRKTRGGCDCGKSIFKGGYGAASFQEIPARYVYPQNDYVMDPNDPHTTMSERLTVKGGQRSKRSKRTKRNINQCSKCNHRKIRSNKTRKTLKLGGGEPYLGNIEGSSFGANAMNGIKNINPAEFSQPVASKFGEHNTPLV